MSIRIDVADGVGILTLDNPDRRNVLNSDTVQEIIGAFEDFETADSGVTAVIVTGAPPAFCAGADLSSLQANSETAKSGGGEASMRSIYDGFLRVGRSPLPTIAAVNGAAVGAGMNLAMCCDVRIAGRRAKFDTRFLQLGLHPGGGHTWMMRRLLGPQGAAATVLFGDVLDGEAAERCGLAWRCVDDDGLVESAKELAGRAAAAPRELVKRVKQTLKAVQTVDDHDEAVDVELTAQMWSLAQPEFRERVAALQKKISSR